MTTEGKRTILVTGSSSGIGAAICRALLAEGHRVIGLSRRQACFDGDYQHHAVDLAQLDALPGKLESLVASHDLDGAVLAAGRGAFRSLEEFSYRQIRELIELDLTAQIFCARALVPHFKARGSGDLVLIGSEAALRGGKKGAIYSAAKFGLRGFAQSLREEGGAAGLRVCLINPGMVETPFFDELTFAPGTKESEHLVAEDVAAAVSLTLSARPGANFDQIDLSPQKKVIRFQRRPPQEDRADR